MSVILKRMRQGARFTIYALADDHGCKLLDFLSEVDGTRPSEAAKLFRLIDFVAEAGPPRNEEKCRKLENDLWEFKTCGGIRVLWFYDAGQIIICSHGFIKQRQKTPRREIEIAADAREKYLKAKILNQVKEES